MDFQPTYEEFLFFCYIYIYIYMMCTVVHLPPYHMSSLGKKTESHTMSLFNLIVCFLPIVRHTLPPHLSRVSAADGFETVDAVFAGYRARSWTSVEIAANFITCLKVRVMLAFSMERIISCRISFPCSTSIVTISPKFGLAFVLFCSTQIIYLRVQSMQALHCRLYLSILCWLWCIFRSQSAKPWCSFPMNVAWP